MLGKWCAMALLKYQLLIEKYREISIGMSFANSSRQLPIINGEV